MTMRRRTFIGSLIASSVSTLGFNSALAQSGKPHIAVVGAGAFGGWTALKLLRSGARVTLLDAWGPGNSRSSSGGESRVIRHSYNKAIYVDMVKRSLELWHEASERWDRPLLHVSGVLHMRRSNSPISLDGSAFLMTAASVPFEMLSHDELTARYPQINAIGIESAMYEPTWRIPQGLGQARESIRRSHGANRSIRWQQLIRRSVCLCLWSMAQDDVSGSAWPTHQDLPTGNVLFRDPGGR
jgi:hypothetical protein